MVFELIVVGVVVLSAVVAYKLWKAGKVVTAGTVLAGDEAAVKGAANTVANTVSTKV